jgi:hypothetical protein
VKFPRPSSGLLARQAASLHAFGERHRAWLLPVLLVTWLALILSLLACARPDWFGLQKNYELSKFRPLGAYGWSTEIRKRQVTIPFGGSRFFGLPRPAILENGVPLPTRIWKPDTETIEQFGHGRYRLLPRSLVFSATDNIPPRQSHRTYEIAIPQFPPNPIILRTSFGAQPQQWNLSRILSGDIIVAAILLLTLLNTRALVALAPWRGFPSLARIPWVAVAAFAPLVVLPLAG